METAKRQAQQNGISLDRELIELLIHGILHLLGFDHEISEKEMEIMYKKEQEILIITGAIGNKNGGARYE